MNSKPSTAGEICCASATVVVLSLASANPAFAQSPESASASAIVVTAQQNQFYCNIKALSPAERARHTQLTEKLISVRKETIETEKGYEFQFSPADTSLAELAAWAATEAKCCPFFDFHLDLERQATLLCLRLTGPDPANLKLFIRSEFHVPAPSK